MSTIASGSRPSPFAVFRNRSFAYLWTGQLVSTIGSSLTSLAASILVYRLTGSALSVGLMLMATALPSVFLGLIAGVFVDRLDRKRIMVVADLIRAVLVTAIPFLLPYGIAWLYIMVALTAAVGQFFDPAHSSVLPEVASDEELAAANSLIAISSFGSTAIGFAASGLIASAFPIEWAFYLDGLTFLISAAAIMAIRLPHVAVEGETNVATVVRNLGAGARFLFGTPILRSLFIISAPVFVIFGLQNSLLLPFALRALGASELEFGLQEGLTSVGFVVGSLLMARLADRLPAGRWIALSFIGMGITGVLYSQASSVVLAIVIIMVSGLLNAPSAIARQLIVQRNTSREVRGRVYSAFFVLRDVVLLAGMAAAGLADFVDVRQLFLWSSLLLVAVGLVTVFMPGLGRVPADLRRATEMLRDAATAPSLAVGRPATLADIDLLAGRLPVFAMLGADLRREMATSAHVSEAPSGTTVVRYGEQSDDAFFVLEGRVVAGREEDGAYRALEVLNRGDFFGEIAALTGSPRTADVVAEQPTTLLRVPSSTIRHLMADQQMNRLFLSKMTERMVRMNMLDLPRYATLDQQHMRELRTEEPTLNPL